MSWSPSTRCASVAARRSRSSANNPVICPRCGAVVVADELTERTKRVIARLDRFGLVEGGRSLFRPPIEP